MQTQSIDRILASLAFLAALIVVAMISGIITTQSGQDFFQSAKSTVDLSARIIGNPKNALGLRINLGLDNALIVVYATYFCFLSLRFRSAMEPMICNIALGAMLLTALLDAVENHHIMMMLHCLEHGLPLAENESQQQMVASAVKFHSSYIGLTLFAFGYFRQNGLGRWIACLLWLGYIPLGILTFAIPVESTKIVTLTRVCFFLLAFVMSGILFLKSARNSGK